MQRSGSSRSSGIFFGAGSSAEPGGAGADDRAGRTAESFKAVCAGGGEPVLAVLPAEGGERGEPGAHAAHGRAAHGVPVLREQADDAASAPRGGDRGPAPDPAAHAPDGGWRQPTGGRARASRVREHRVFPYLLRGLEISRADHVWCADITYVPVTQGFFYLVAVMDWATRHVLAWRLSNTMDASFCVPGAGRRAGLAGPGDPEHRSGLPVHQRGVRRPGAGRGRGVLDGRPGPLPRQHLHRAAVAVAEVRGRVPP